jgi:prevent-host-death family protein
MRETPLYEVKNRLSAIVAEVERTGEAVAITRHGKIVARIVPPEQQKGETDDLPRLLARLRANADARAKASPAKAEAMSWEQLKGLMRDGLA